MPLIFLAMLACRRLAMAYDPRRAEGPELTTVHISRYDIKSWGGSIVEDGARTHMGVQVGVVCMTIQISQKPRRKGQGPFPCLPVHK